MRVRALVAVLAATALAPATADATTTIGNRLFESAQDEIGVCGFSGVTIVNRSCTVAQAGENPELVAAGGETAPFSGIVVRWRIVTGIAPIGTEAIAARLHPLAGETGGVAESAYAQIPLQPGLHEFASRLPISKGEELALDTRITNAGNEYAGLPIVHYASESGSPVEWSPALGEGETREPGFFTSPTSSYDLMLNADIEPDADHDGYGDETQDGCPTDPTRHGACFSSSPPPRDTTPPRTKLTYRVDQSFLAKKSVLLHLRSNEDASAIASGQLEYAKEKGRTGRVIYGLRGVKREVTAGAKTTLRLRLPKKTRSAGARAIALGKRVVVKVTVTATDAAGNRSGATVGVIHPKG